MNRFRYLIIATICLLFLVITTYLAPPSSSVVASSNGRMTNNGSAAQSQTQPFSLYLPAIRNGADHSDNAGSAADVLGVVVDENVTVLQVEVGSAAEKAGVQVGDVLETIEGVSLRTERARAKQIISEPKSDKRLTLKFKRTDQAMELIVSPAPPTAQPVAGTATPVPTRQDYF